MPILRIEHHVPNFENWKRAFDSDPVGRQRSGVRRYSILRDVDDPNYVLIDLEFNSREEAEGLLVGMQQVWGRVQGSIIDAPRTRIVDIDQTVEF